jgi:hypothetical protein
METWRTQNVIYYKQKKVRSLYDISVAQWLKLRSKEKFYFFKLLLCHL